MGYVREQMDMLSLKWMCSRQKKMGNCKDLRDFDMDKIAMARGLGQSNYKTEDFVGFCGSEVVRTYQK